MIQSSLQSNAAERKDAIKKGGAVFAFTLKNKSDATESWFIDLKTKGEVGKGYAPEGRSADGTFLFGQDLRLYKCARVAPSRQNRLGVYFPEDKAGADYRI